MMESLYDSLKALFTGRGSSADDRAREESARMLEMDEPMAGAGAQLSASHRKSETELALERAGEARESNRKQD
jgi:hypothetical protein